MDSKWCFVRGNPGQVFCLWSNLDRPAYQDALLLFLNPCKYRLKSLLGLMFVTAAITAPRTVQAQREAPRGSYLLFSGAFAGGYGGQLGIINARDFFTREVLILGDFHAALDPGNGSNQVVFLIGGALRVFGFDRMIGNAAYRGFDLDLGFRVGPGFTFSTRETRADKNRRFNLFLEPYLRLSVGVGSRNALLFEWATTRPNVRLGFWLGL